MDSPQLMAIDFLANGDQEGEKVGYYLGYSLLIDRSRDERLNPPIRN